MRKYDFLYRVCTSKAALRKLTLIPGETAYIFLQQISDKLKLDFAEVKQEFDKQSIKKDGTILAESYILPIGMKAKAVIKYLLSYTDMKYKKYSNKIFGSYIESQWYNYITIASIIQKEAGNKDEMPLISSVIYNRLKKGMKLQMDGTLNYAQYSHIAVTPKRIKEDNSPYNTYKYKGLPKNPICAVTLDSIKAAIFPSKTKYLYFMKDSKDPTKHIFTASYKQHKKNIRKYRKSNKKRKQKRKKSKQKRRIKSKKKNKKIKTKKRHNKKIKSPKKLW
jgi:UPF0755 protein